MSVWDQLEQQATSARQGTATPTSVWDQLETGRFTPAKPPSRGFLGAANDYVIEAANAILGGGKALIDFAVPGTELANQIEDLIKQGEESQSDVARQAKQRLGEDIEAGGMQALKGVGSYIVENPALALSQAVGSFAIPMGAIRGSQIAARGLGVGERAVARASDVGPITRQAAVAAERKALERVGTGAGMGIGAALGAGEAGGDAYGQVYEGLIEQGVDPVEADRQATEAARLAMPAPAIVGAIAGRFGAEKAVAARSRQGSILRMAGSEAAQEFAEEGTTKLSANVAAGQYIDGIDPMKGVLGSAALGAALGGMTGAAIGTITPIDKQPGSMLSGANDNLQGSRTPSGDAIRQAINTGPKLPDVISVTTRGEAFVTPEQQQAYQQFGQMGGRVDTAVPGRPATTPPSAPAGTAQPSAQPTARVQPAQSQPVSQEEYLTAARTYGLAPAANMSNAWDLGGARIYGQPTVKAVVEGLAQADRQLSPVQRTLNGAFLAANVIKLSGNIANAKPVVNALNKATQKYGLVDVGSTQEALARIDDQIAALARQGKPATNPMVEQLDAIYTALTGQSSPLYTQLLEGTPNEPQQQAATRVGAVSEQAGTDATVGTAGRTDLGSVQSLLTGGVPGGPAGLQNVPAGDDRTRDGATVTPAGGSAADVGTVSGQVPTQGEVNVIRPAGGTGEGTQADVGRAAGAGTTRAEGTGAGPAAAAVGTQQAGKPRQVRARAEEDVTLGKQLFDGIAKRFEIAIRFNDLDPALQEVWLVAVENDRTDRAIVEALAQEQELIRNDISAQQILDLALARLYPADKQAAKRSFILEMYGTPQAKREESVAELAKRYNRSIDTIKKDWNRAIRDLLGPDKQKLTDAIKAAMVELRLSDAEATQYLTSLMDSIKAEQTEGRITEAEVEELTIDEAELGAEDAAITARGRATASLQEVNKAAETNNQKFLRISQALDAIEARQKPTRKQIDQANEALQREKNDIAELTEKQLETLAIDAYLNDDEFFGDRIVKELNDRLEVTEDIAEKQAAKKPITAKGEPRAVQKQTAAKVPVQPRARGGEKVGQEVRGAEKPAATGEAKTEGQVKAVRAEKIVETPGTDPIGFARYQALMSFDNRNSSDYSSPEEAIDFGLDNLNDTLTEYNVTDRFIREQAVEAYRNEITRLEKGAVVALTKAEQVEAKYNELRAFAPDLIPVWGALTVAQRDSLLAIDNPADINVRNLEQILDESKVIDVEAREIAPTERRLMLEKSNTLTDEQTQVLQAHYKAKAGTDAFLSKLSQDIANYTNKGAEFVAARIRAIIAQLAKAVVAVAVVFNPTVQQNGFDFNLPEAYAKAKQITIELPTSARSKMSPLAQSVFTEMAATAQISGKGFIIADKPNGMIHVFDKDGNVIAQDTALYGRDVGDVLGSASSLEGGKKVTPAGKYALEAVKLRDGGTYAGGYTLDLVGTNDGTGTIAIHAAYLGNVNEKRLERLASPDVKDNRVSYGCINTSHKTFLDKIIPNINKLDGGMVFVLPDSPETFSMPAAPTAPQPAKTVQFSKKRRREEGSSAANVKKEMAKFLGAENERAVAVVQSIEDIPADVRAAVEKASGGPITADTQGFVYERRAYLIADNIRPGTERAVIMHEVGSHLGLENILSEDQFDTLVDQILTWTEKTDDSIEAVVATKALLRVINANPSMETRNAELVAYFIEEAILAGVNPTATATQTGFGSWFRTLWTAFKSAIRKLGMNPDRMDAIDVVNMAYGAARLEVAGTWHGTAANFRKFSHAFMGKGEGAQAYGWGTYVAQRAGIAYEYMIQDAARKTKGDIFRMLDGYPVTSPEFYYALDDARKAGVDISLAWLRSLENEYKKRIEPNIPQSSWGWRNDALSDVQRAIRVGGVKYVPLSKSQGNLLRVDINAKQDELLNWDIPIQEQPAIVKKLKADPIFQLLLDTLDEGVGFTFNSSADLFTSDGSYFYRGLVELVEYGRFAAILDAIDQGTETTREIKADKIVSEFLDSIGIKGIKFLDARSRIKSKSFYKQQIANFKLLSESEKQVEQAFGIKPTLTPEEVELRLAELQAKLDAAPEDYTLTQNIVVFNDKNLVRVASLPEAKQQQVKFSKRADAAINRLPDTLQPQATQIFYTLKDWASKAAPTFAFTQDLVDMAKGKLKSVTRFVQLYNEQQVIQTEYELRVKAILDDYDALPAEVRGTGPNSVNAFIKDSTMSGKWGYKIKEESDVTPDPALEARFNAFPKEAQKVIKDVFKHGYDVLQDMKRTLRENTNSEFDALIEEARAKGNEKEVAELQAAKDLTLKNYQKLFALQGKKPYAPLKRFGDYVVVGKSQRLLDAEEIYRNSQGSARALANKTLTDLQTDPQHYYVGFAETAGEGQVIANQLRRQFPDMQVTDPFEKSAQESLYGGNDLNQVFARLRNLVDENLKSSDKDVVVRGVRKMILDLQTQMLSNQSIMHATNRRLGIAGADDDMMRAFATQGRASAHFIGSLSNTGKIYEQLRNMSNESKNDPEARRYFNEFVRRHAMGFDYDPSPVLNKAMATTSLWMLLTSPAYYLQNMTQPLMMSVPFMAGRHGEGRSLKAMFSAYKEVGNLLQNISIKRPGEQVDFSTLPEDVRGMVEDLVKRGRIQITLDRDLGEFTSGEDSAFKKLGKVSGYLQAIAEKTELINRVSTAVAAYRLAIGNRESESAARDYADKVIRVTHGDYSGANAPRFMRKGIGRLVTQFRKFQLIQISMMIRLLNDATRGATAEDKRAARYTLLWVFTHAGVAGGIMGLPGFAAAAALYGMLFGDEDEPFEPELELRRYFGDEIGTLMTKGLPAQMGVDVSGKIGAGQMLSILPYADFDLSKAGWQEVVTAAMGPFIGGLAPRVIDGISYMNDGNYYKGVENLMPKGVTDTLKAARFATEGVTQRNNDVSLSADEISFADAMFQALGLPTTKLTERQFRTGVVIRTEEFFDKRTAEIKRNYTKAYRENDVEAIAEARDAWKRVQDARVASGFTRQPLSNLLKAPQEQRKRERQTEGGVQYTQANRRFVESLP